MRALEAHADPAGLSLKVEAVYVLSEKGFHDRILHVIQELKSFRVPFEFVFDFDCKSLSDTQLSVFGESNLGLPHKALVLKHLETWRLACAHGYSRILVFEDDILLSGNFHRLVSKALTATDVLDPGWLIYLGGADTKVPASFFREPGPLVPMPIATTEGYVTDLAACQRRLAWCGSHKILLPADGLIRHIDREVGNRQFWLTDPAVEQGSVTGLFASKLDAHRMKRGRFFSMLRNRWNKFQRRQIRQWWARTLG